LNKIAFEIEFSTTKPKKGCTKFGGQPDWINEIQWPIGKTSGKPMKFVCQIDLTEIGLTNVQPKLAYFFTISNGKKTIL